MSNSNFAFNRKKLGSTKNKALFLGLLPMISLVILCNWIKPIKLTESISPTTSVSSTPTPELLLEWSYKFPVDGYVRQALIDENKLYFTSFGYTTRPVVAGFDLKTNQLLWSIEQEPLIPMAKGSAALYLITDNNVSAISASDGSTLWQTPVPSEDAYLPNNELLASEVLVFYVATNDLTSEIHALEAQTGATMWTAPLPPIDWFRTSWQRSSFGYAMSYDEGVLYVRVSVNRSPNQFMLIALDTQSGQRLWDFPFTIDFPLNAGDSPEAAASELAFSEQAIYFGTVGDMSYAIQRDTGKLLWKREIQIDKPEYIDGQIVAFLNKTPSGNYLPGIGALDSQNGDLLWMTPFQDIEANNLTLASPFILLGDYLILYSWGIDSNQLLILSIESGELVSRMTPAFSDGCQLAFVSFAADDETLYLVTEDCIHSFHIPWRD